MPHDYKRNGTAALNVLDGSVVGRNMQRHRHQQFILFLSVVGAELPPDNAVHAIPDNCATPKQPEPGNSLVRHPRWTSHFAPTSCHPLQSARVPKQSRSNLGLMVREGRCCTPPASEIISRRGRRTALHSAGTGYQTQAPRWA